MELNYFKCDVCCDKGWIKSLTLGSLFIEDFSEVIEKCDACGIFLNDNDAAKYVDENENIITFQYDSGFNILLNFSDN
jgi:hypothetical protein